MVPDQHTHTHTHTLRHTRMHPHRCTQCTHSDTCPHPHSACMHTLAHSPTQVCTRTHIAHPHTCVHTLRHRCTHSHSCTHMHILRHMHTPTHVHTRTGTRAHTLTHCTRTDACVHTHTPTCCLHAYWHTCAHSPTQSCTRTHTCAHTRTRGTYISGSAPPEAESLRQREALRPSHPPALRLPTRSRPRCPATYSTFVRNVGCSVVGGGDGVYTWGWSWMLWKTGLSEAPSSPRFRPRLAVLGGRPCFSQRGASPRARWTGGRRGPAAVGAEASGAGGLGSTAELAEGSSRAEPCPPNSHVGTLAPGTSERGCLWRSGLERGD